MDSLKNLLLLGHRGLVLLECQEQAEKAIEGLFAEVRPDLNENDVILWVQSKKRLGKKPPRLNVSWIPKFCSYRNTETVLGLTVSGLILEDLSGLTPNGICRLVETVAFRGLIVFLVHPETEKLQLDMSKKFNESSLAADKVPCYFLRRVAQSLYHNAIGLDSHLKPLKRWPGNKTSKAILEESGTERSSNLTAVQTREDLCANVDQSRCLQSYTEFCLNSSPRRRVMWLTAPRGRGKSALLGLIAARLLSQSTSLTIMAPDLTNVQTLISFAETALKHTQIGFERSSKSSGVILKLHSSKSQASTACMDFISAAEVDWNDVHRLPFASKCRHTIIFIDEAASIPTPIIQYVLASMPIVLLSSTVTGYEGTGRSLALKLLKTLQSEAAAKKIELLRDTLSVPIRYREGDVVEKWLYELHCIPSEQNVEMKDPQEETPDMPNASEMFLYEINKAALFGQESPAAEQLLKKITSIFAESHYRNSPDDMLMLADNSTHVLYVLCPKWDPQGDREPVIICAAQVAFEGGMDAKRAEATFTRGGGGTGDLTPCKLLEISRDTSIAKYIGARIVRIATKEEYQRKGYGTTFLKFLKAHLTRKQRMTQGENSSSHLEKWSQLISSLSQNSSKIELLTEPEGPLFQADYISTCFGLTIELLNFWQREGFKCVSISHQRQEKTGEFSSIFVSGLEETFTPYCTNCLSSVYWLLGDALASLPVSLATQLILHLAAYRAAITIPELTSWQLARLEAYVKRQCERSLIRDLWPLLAQTFVADCALSLSPLQSVIIIGLGAQRKSVDTLSSELRCAPVQILGQLEKLVAKYVSLFKGKASAAKRAIPQPSSDTPPKKFKNLM